ncbi:MAG TPA: hypothetical protein VG777_03740 [Thermoanaerobaculia bacterium]|nr:hypothetical protein [Thermoanaerobaculia bacterium]
MIRPFVRGTLAAFVMGAVTTGAASAAVPSRPSLRSAGKVTTFGKVSLLHAPTQDWSQPTTFREAPKQDRSFQRFISGTVAPARVPASHVPTPAGSGLADGSGGFGFDGLNDVDQGFASGFVLEPPDQGLAAGGGLVLEAINSAFTFFDASTGANLFGPGSAVGLSYFSGLDPTDPRCYYDPNTGQWFITYLGLGSRDYVVIAVSAPGDPFDYMVYGIDTTDDGDFGTPAHAGCPCFGDQPLIGSDQYGFYVSTNEFGEQFNGAQIYAIDKAALESWNPAPNIVQFSPGSLEEGIAYSVQPASVPPGGSFDLSNGGSEYFLSALEFFNTLDNRIAAWAITGSSNLPSNPAAVTLQEKTIASEIYGAPPANQQAPGPLPLRDALATGYFEDSDGNPVYIKEHEELVQSNDDRMNQVVFADGLLWSGLNTVVKTKNGPTRTGIAYFAVSPNFPDAGSFEPSVTTQGYIAVNNQSAIFPSIGVNAFGKGVVSFSVVGPGLYPGAAWARIDAVNGAGTPTLAGPGAGPDDGFSGYSAFGGDRVGRWGDYSAAVSDENGDIWLASEYIPSRPRFIYANWGTFVSKVTP